MGFRTEFTEADDRTGTCRIILSIGSIVIRSPSGTISDHFRDLKANKHFLAQQQLATLFLGETPIVNINYGNGGLATAYIYTKSGGQTQKALGTFHLSEALSYLAGVLDALEVALNVTRSDPQALVEQVESDISSGVYDVYLNEAVG